MARVLIVGGGCRGLRLAEDLIAAGHAVRVSTRTESGRAAIEAVGAECWIGDPDRVVTLRQALDRVTVTSWMLGTARGGAEALQALYGTRLEYWLTQVIDTTVRGFVYEAGGTAPSELRAAGAQLVREMCERNAIPYAIVDSEPGEAGWVATARASIESFLRSSN